MFIKNDQFEIAKDMQPGSTLKSKLVGDRGKGFKKSLDEKEK